MKITTFMMIQLGILVFFLIYFIYCPKCKGQCVCCPTCCPKTTPQLKHNGPDGSDDIDTEYIVYGTLRCGYTVKMINHLKEIGKGYMFVDVSKHEDKYNKVLNHYGVKRSGVPFTVHTPSDTYFIGYKQVK